MKVFWTASYSGKKIYQKDYDLVARAIDRISGIEVISPEKGNYQSLIPPKIKQSLSNDPKKLHY